MRQGLIGYSGFVGSNLATQWRFDAHYNRSNIDSLGAEAFDLLVVAAPSAVKWYANQHPDEDRAHVQSLIEALRNVRAKSLVLFSTVDVYPVPCGVDEASVPSETACLPYGRHRLALERFVYDHFNSWIIRLPGLFGRGLKKNVIFDYLHQNAIATIDTRAQYQFYSLSRLGSDLRRILDRDFRLLHITVEPTSVAEIGHVCMGMTPQNELPGTPARYDFKSRYAEQFGGRNGYWYSKQVVLNDLSEYVAAERRKI